MQGPRASAWGGRRSLLAGGRSAGGGWRRGPGSPCPPTAKETGPWGGAPPAAVGEALLRPLALTRAPTVARQPLLPSCAPAPSRSLSSQADVTTKILKGASLH